MSEFAEEEVVETEEVVSEESSYIDVQVEEPAGDLEQSLDALVCNLALPEDTLRLVASTGEGKLLLEKVEERLNEKNREIEEYESALNDFTQSMSQQACE